MFGKLKDSRGISLIEFLLNVAILIVLFTLAFPAYMTFRDKLENSYNRSYQQAEFRQDSIP